MNASSESGLCAQTSSLVAVGVIESNGELHYSRQATNVYLGDILSPMDGTDRIPSRSRGCPTPLLASTDSAQCAPESRRVLSFLPPVLPHEHGLLQSSKQIL